MLQKLSIQGKIFNGNRKYEVLFDQESSIGAKLLLKYSEEDIRRALDNINISLTHDYAEVYYDNRSSIYTGKMTRAEFTKLLNQVITSDNLFVVQDGLFVYKLHDTPHVIDSPKHTHNYGHEVIGLKYQFLEGYDIIEKHFRYD